MKFLLGLVVGVVAAGVAMDWLLKNHDWAEERWAGVETEKPSDRSPVATHA